MDLGHAGIDLALRQGTPGEDYNIGTGSEVDGVTVADTVIQLLDKPATLKRFVQDRLGHDQRYALDITKLRALGWTPTIDFAEGMRRTIDWYVANEAWWRPLKSGEFWEFYQRNYKPAASDGSGASQARL